jgi:hypothetical protein
MTAFVPLLEPDVGAVVDVEPPDEGVVIGIGDDIDDDGVDIEDGVDMAGAGVDIGIVLLAGIGEVCADAMLVDASARAAASMSRLDCCMLEAPMNAGCLSGAVLPQRNEFDACSV